MTSRWLDIPTIIANFPTRGIEIIIGLAQQTLFPHNSGVRQTDRQTMTTTLLAQIAPQRSTQYAQLASSLAPAELYLSPPGDSISRIEFITLGGQDYLKFDLPTVPDDDQLEELAMLALTTGLFVYHDHIGDQSGPLLRPLETNFQPFLPPEIVMTRRYRGKTNEMFTHFLCNLARYSSAFAHRPWSTLRVCDPLAGGGTTLLTALVLGADVVGVERNVQDVQLTVAFLRQYAREAGVACKVKEQRLKKLGKRWWMTIGRDQPRQFVLAQGETAQADQLISGFKNPHLIVTDLPYGIQHQGELVELLTQALPVWAKMLLPGGALVFAWDSTRFARDDMIDVVESACDLVVLDGEPYDQLAHQVDRVIKRRDVLVARHVADG